MEICTRAISFYSYQVSQEICFQTMLYKNLEDKYSGLEKQLQGIVRDANAEITSLRERVTALQKDQELEKRKAHDLHDQLLEKTRQFQKLQTMYEKLKRKTLVPTLQQTVQNTIGPGGGQGGVMAGQIGRRPFTPAMANGGGSRAWRVGGPVAVAGGGDDRDPYVYQAQPHYRNPQPQQQQ
ncbi:hypothetical protein BC936DRAFT_145762, partial [Jimgerdemannia flammicorona]